MKTILLSLLLVTGATVTRAQIPVIDASNLVQSEINQAAIIAKWVESIAQLQTQVSQLNEQISLQSDIHAWTGNPVTAGATISLTGLGSVDLTVTYGQSDTAILGSVNSLASLSNTAQGTYQTVPLTDITGQTYQPNDLTYRRYSVLDAKQSNLDQVTAQTSARETDLQTQIAATLVQLKNASTQSEVQKLSAQLTLLNGQLEQVEAQRRHAADDFAEQKAANDSRNVEERSAASDLADRDDYLANQQITTYMQTLKVRQNFNGN